MPDPKPIREWATDLAKIDQLPADEVRIAIVAEGGDVGASVEGHRDIGKPGGWTAAGEASIFKRAGWKVAALLNWKGKP